MIMMIIMMIIMIHIFVQVGLLKAKLDTFVRSHELEGAEAARAGGAGGGRRLFVLQGVVTEEAWQVARGIASSLFCCMCKGTLFSTWPSSIKEQALLVNPVVLRLVEEEYLPASLNVVLLDWLEDRTLVRRIVALNLYH